MPLREKVDAKRLDKKELKYIEHMASTRFNTHFWGSVNVKRVIRQLVGHIKYMEAQISNLKGN